ncbi:MAG TPA: hypothetical protein VD788_14740, partial [Candidatus Polarisedimenticolaceae bacterium]|nr:hypothetical protein [Candidatus Polarisedimenticolaceae bacterium]
MSRPPRVVASIVAAMAALSPGTGVAESSELRAVEVAAEVYAAERTPAEAKREALQRARDLAVARAAGIHVRAQQLRLVSEEPEAV